MSADSLSHLTDERYLLQRGGWELFRQTCRIYDSKGALVLYSKQRAFRPRAVIPVYTDEGMTTGVMLIKSFHAVDRGFAYDVSDSTTGRSLGGLRRRLLRSFATQCWSVLDSNGEECGEIRETLRSPTVLRSLFIDFAPRQFIGSIGGEPVFTLTQHFSPFTTRYGIDFSMDHSGRLDRRMGIAVAIVLSKSSVHHL